MESINYSESPGCNDMGQRCRFQNYLQSEKQHLYGCKNPFLSKVSRTVPPNWFSNCWRTISHELGHALGKLRDLYGNRSNRMAVDAENRSPLHRQIGAVPSAGSRITRLWLIAFVAAVAEIKRLLPFHASLLAGPCVLIPYGGIDIAATHWMGIATMGAVSRLFARGR
jgi:hypothetical protein